MNYSIHTIGLRKIFKNHIEYHRAEKELFSKARGRFGVETNTKGNEHYAFIFQGKGIRVILKKTKISGYYDFILSLNDLLGTEDKSRLIDPPNLNEALDIAESMLVREFGEDYAVNALELYRVDQCINVDVGSADNVSEYISLMYRSEMKKGYEVLIDDSQDFDSSRSFTIRNKTEGLEVSFYDKKKELAQRDCVSEIAEGTLRVELRILRRKSLEKQTPGCNTNRERVAYCMAASREKILAMAHSLLLDADYYPYKKACAKVRTSIRNKKLRSRMLDMLKLVRKKSSVRKAKEKMFELHPKLRHEYYNKMINEFESIGVNVVTLDKDSEVKFLPSLLEYLR